MKASVAALVGLGLTTMLTEPSTASVSDNFPCPIPRGFVSVSLRSALPAPLQAMFNHAVMPGEDFNTSDAGMPGEGLLFVWNKDRRWIVASGHGGIALFLSVHVFQLSADGKSASDVTPRHDPNVSAPCALATRYVESVAR